MAWKAQPALHSHLSCNVPITTTTTLTSLSWFCCLCLESQVLGLVDWNPSGVSILKTYKYGGGNLDSSRYGVSQLAAHAHSMLPWEQPTAAQHKQGMFEA